MTRAVAPLAAFLATLAMSASVGDVAAQQIVGQGIGGGCGINLPGAEDRDSGLAGEYVSRRAGQSFLFAPHVTVRGMYTDNVELAPEGEEESEYIIGLLPGFSLCSVGNRVRGQLNYTAEGYYYTEDQDRNDIYHELEAIGQAELVEDNLFVDVTALNEQRVIDSQRTFSDDNALLGGNRADAFTYSISPYWRQSLGSLGFGQVGYRHRRTMYGDDEDDEGVDIDRGDTYSNAYRASIVSPPGNDRWQWEADVTEERLREQGIDDTEYFGQAGLTLGYRLTARLTALGQAGLQHDYERDGSTDRFGSEFYNAGLRWEGPRTQIEGRVGRQFFGTSYFASITRQSRQLESRITYTETPQNRSRLDLARGQRGIGDPQDGAPPPEAESGLTSLGQNEIFVQRRLNANATYTTGRSTFNLNAYVDDREAVREGQDEEAYGAGASWRWQLATRTSFIPTWRWERREFDDGQVDYIYRYQASIARLLSDTVQVGATVRHQRQNSTAELNEYEENSVLLEITKVF